MSPPLPNSQESPKRSPLVPFCCMPRAQPFIRKPSCPTRVGWPAWSRLLHTGSRLLQLTTQACAQAPCRIRPSLCAHVPCICAAPCPLAYMFPCGYAQHQRLQSHFRHRQSLTLDTGCSLISDTGSSLTADTGSSLTSDTGRG